MESNAFVSAWVSANCPAVRIFINKLLENSPETKKYSEKQITLPALCSLA